MNNTKGRPKKYSTPYTSDSNQMQSIFQEYLACVADCFGKPYDDRVARSDDAPSLQDVCDEFGISILKARKLLITARMYSTEQSRKVAELAVQGKSVADIIELTGLKKSSVSSYLPYQKFSYKLETASHHLEDSRRYRERRKAVEDLHRSIIEKSVIVDDTFWQAVIAYQNYPFHTFSGLPFSYTVKRKKNGEYSGELLVSRKEGSKTLTRSSVMLAFHTVFEEITTVDVIDSDGSFTTVLVRPEYKGPKAIGQIFGISYVYSLLWKLGLIKVPTKYIQNQKVK